MGICILSIVSSETARTDETFKVVALLVVGGSADVVLGVGAESLVVVESPEGEGGDETSSSSGDSVELMESDVGDEVDDDGELALGDDAFGDWAELRLRPNVGNLRKTMTVDLYVPYFPPYIFGHLTDEQVHKYVFMKFSPFLFAFQNSDLSKFFRPIS
ncbi:hypothetical protein RND71_026390 [Anisodus tanguticus]|uniref:Uncharacterized protein n=1 Tax=Anisodus tanguticus TaxID=243964 RepID=A0AAE1RM81_9SOLA|nr:hypothetical protein RND71_026390 [Anisodus tanguticus]